MNYTENIAQTEEMRLGAMRFMFAATSIIALPMGLIMVMAPEIFTNWLGWVLEEPLFPGAYGGCLIAFGVLCGLGYRSPVKFSPVLFFQFTYKLAWFLLVWVPLWLNGELPDYHVWFTFGMVGAMLIDVYAVPFGYLLRKDS